MPTVFFWTTWYISSRTAVESQSHRSCDYRSSERYNCPDVYLIEHRATAGWGHLESGVRVTCDVGYLCANFSLPRLSVLDFDPMYSTGRQTSDAHDRLMPIRAEHNTVSSKGRTCGPLWAPIYYLYQPQSHFFTCLGDRYNHIPLIGWGRLWVSSAFPVPSITMPSLFRPAHFSIAACDSVPRS